MHRRYMFWFILVFMSIRCIHWEYKGLVLCSEYDHINLLLDSLKVIRSVIYFTTTGIGALIASPRYAMSDLHAIRYINLSRPSIEENLRKRKIVNENENSHPWFATYVSQLLF